MGAQCRQFAAVLGVPLRAPTPQETAQYGWRDGMAFVFEPTDPDVADIVVLTRMFVNWRMVAVRPDQFGYLDIVAHWCFHHQAGNTMSFVAAVRALAGWGGRVDAGPEGYVKMLDHRPETRAGRRAR